MMKLSQLLEQIEYTCVQGGLDKEIKSVVYDSRKVTPDSLFLCIKGAVSDGHKYAKEVVEKGATVLDRKSTRLNSSHIEESRMPSSA